LASGFAQWLREARSMHWVGKAPWLAAIKLRTLDPLRYDTGPKPQLETISALF